MNLCRCKDKIITDDEIKLKLSNVGVCSGDTILLHTDMFGFGRPMIKRNLFLDTICQILFDIVGESGTILMPTFTYSFCNTEIYNVQESCSKMGVLNEYFRLKFGTRTHHPIFSFAVYGKNSELFLGTDNTSCFGNNSLFARLYEINARLVFFGTSIARNTFIHFIERSFGVSYRHDKRFEGVIINGKNKVKTYCDYYVRDLNNKSLCDYTRIEPFLKEFKSEKIANTKISSVTTKDVYDTGFKILKNNEKFFLLDE